MRPSVGARVWCVLWGQTRPFGDGAMEARVQIDAVANETARFDMLAVAIDRG